MNDKFKLYFLLLITVSAFVSCRKNDDGGMPPPRDYAEQYAADLDSIEDYLKTHYLTVIDEGGLIDVDIKPLPEDGSQTAIFDSPMLKSILVRNSNRTTNRTDGIVDDPVLYKVYYILLNEGGGERAAVTDSVYTSYRGWKLDNTEFDRNDRPFWSTYPPITAGEVSLIPGYREFLPILRTATGEVNNGDGTYSFINAGSGVVFLPSGLAYFNSSSGSISPYTPIAFLIRLNKMQPRDHDRDGILSNFENRTEADPETGYKDIYLTDKDLDFIPDFLDTDDDNDGYSTRREITVPGSDPEVPYAFDLIPDCAGGTTGTKRHLDSNCH